MSASIRVSWPLRRCAPVLAASVLLVSSLPAHAQATFVQGKTAGFVVSEIAFALADDAAKTGACPKGLNSNAREVFETTPEGQRRKDESDKEYQQRGTTGAEKYSNGADGISLCLTPESGETDPNFRTVVGATNLKVEGIDLDGRGPRAGRGAAPGTCQHQEFSGKDGVPGVDNQFYRAVGCSRGFQSTGQANTFATEMLTGAWGILLTLSGVDDIRNDDDVEVGIYANADPIQLSADRAPLPYATYAMDQDPRFRAKTHGRIKDGVLTTDPVDVRFHHVRNAIFVERTLGRARLHATIAKDGTVTGYLAGYAKLEELWDLQFGHRQGKDAAGKPVPARRVTGTVNGSASSAGFTCPAMYHALYKLADGDLDPKTGRCNSISMQYRIAAIPAFVVDVTTESVNAKLAEKPKYDR